MLLPPIPPSGVKFGWITMAVLGLAENIPLLFSTRMKTTISTIVVFVVSCLLLCIHIPVELTNCETDKTSHWCSWYLCTLTELSQDSEQCKAVPLHYYMFDPLWYGGLLGLSTIFLKMLWSGLDHLLAGTMVSWLIVIFRIVHMYVLYFRWKLPLDYIRATGVIHACIHMVLFVGAMFDGWRRHYLLLRLSGVFEDRIALSKLYVGSFHAVLMCCGVTVPFTIIATFGNHDALMAVVCWWIAWIWGVLMAHDGPIYIPNVPDISTLFLTQGVFTLNMHKANTRGTEYTLVLNHPATGTIRSTFPQRCAVWSASIFLMKHVVGSDPDNLALFHAWLQGLAQRAVDRLHRNNAVMPVPAPDVALCRQHPGYTVLTAISNNGDGNDVACFVDVFGTASSVMHQIFPIGQHDCCIIKDWRLCITGVVPLHRTYIRHVLGRDMLPLLDAAGFDLSGEVLVEDQVGDPTKWNLNAAGVSVRTYDGTKYLTMSYQTMLAQQQQNPKWACVTKGISHDTLDPGIDMARSATGLDYLFGCMQFWSIRTYRCLDDDYLNRYCTGYTHVVPGSTWRLCQPKVVMLELLCEHNHPLVMDRALATKEANKGDKED
eukprot:TRINITY_DN62996_c0_g1_i1.p1 TRINITY_DN62996_c0_g1~~TRINITY_DN62996_c0_g1_i1.p1  ORF type:complete len:602 (+),score=15.72 TRINITY_DN62996_c0_g1_i1:197-2002(+)